MSGDTYASLHDSLLAYKRANKLGRFDPEAPSQEEAQVQHFAREVEERRIAIGRRCRLLPPSTQPGPTADADGNDRRGEIAYIGEIQDLPSVGAWIGVRLDEPTGRNDGSVKGKYYFDCGGVKRGAFVRPERIEVGDYPIIDPLAEEMEEI